MKTQIAQRQRKTKKNYYIFYQYKGYSGGYCFPCDTTGNIDESKLTEGALENLRHCRRQYSQGLMEEPKIEEYVYEDFEELLCREVI